MTIAAQSSFFESLNIWLVTTCLVSSAGLKVYEVMSLPPRKLTSWEGRQEDRQRVPTGVWPQIYCVHLIGCQLFVEYLCAMWDGREITVVHPRVSLLLSRELVVHGEIGMNAKPEVCQDWWAMKGTGPVLLRSSLSGALLMWCGRVGSAPCFLGNGGGADMAAGVPLAGASQPTWPCRSYPHKQFPNPATW